MTVLCYVLSIYTLILFVRILLSWFPPPRSDVARAIVGFIYDITDPVLRPLRSVIPPLRMGMVALDLSPIIVFVILGVVRAALGCPGFII